MNYPIIILMIIFIFYWFYQDNIDRFIKFDSSAPKSDYEKSVLHFLDAIQEYNTYNPIAYTGLRKTLLHMLQLDVDISIGVQYCKHHYDVINDLSRKALNHLHSIIYTLPLSSVTEKKFNDAQTKLRNILNKMKKEIIHKCNDEHLNPDMLVSHDESGQFYAWI